MRVAVVTESFLPQVNGVTSSVQRTCEHLRRRGHEVLVVAPGDGPRHWAGARVLRTPAVPVPGHADVRLSLPWTGIAGALQQFRPDVVHLASPAMLGAHAAFAAHRLGLPLVAVYQTDLAGFASRYGLWPAGTAVRSWVRRVHGLADRTLAPSRDAVADLRRTGVKRVECWAHGVDLERFHPRHRDAALRAELAPGGEVLVGCVDDGASEHLVDLLAGLDSRPGVRLIVLGDGSHRGRLEQLLPRAHFLTGGAGLPAALASLDVVVQPEPSCQGAQEAMASGVPVVAPATAAGRELVRPGHTGYLFEPGSAASMLARVTTLVNDADLRAQLAVAARETLATRTWEVLGDELLGHYRAVRAGVVAA